MDYKGLYDDPADEPQPENRANRRAQERAANRQAATPPKERRKRPTYAEMLARLVVDWDLTFGKNAKGEDILWPVTLENIETIDYAIRLDMLTAIMDDYVSRPQLTTLSKRFSEAATGNGPTTGVSSSTQDGLTTPASLPGPMPVTSNGASARSGTSGSAT